MHSFNLPRLSILFLLLLTLPAHARDREGTERGGGDSYALEFVTAARTTMEYLAQNPSCLPAEVSLPRLRSALDSTPVYSETHTYIENAFGVNAGPDVLAVTYPDTCEYNGSNTPGKPCIIVNRSRWDEIKSDAARIIQLGFHEYFRVLRLEDDHYAVSAKIEPCLSKAVANLEVSIAKKRVVLASLSAAFPSEDDPATCLIFTDGTGSLIRHGGNDASVTPINVAKERFDQIQQMAQELATPILVFNLDRGLIPSDADLFETKNALGRLVVAPTVIDAEHSPSYVRRGWNSGFVSLSSPLYFLVRKACGFAD